MVKKEKKINQGNFLFFVYVIGCKIGSFNLCCHHSCCFRHWLYHSKEVATPFSVENILAVFSAIPYCYWTNREALSTKREKRLERFSLGVIEGGRRWRAALIMHGDCWWLDCVRPAAQRRGGEQRAGTRSRADSLTPVATFSHALKNRLDCAGPGPQTPQSHWAKQKEKNIRLTCPLCWIHQYQHLK